MWGLPQARMRNRAEGQENLLGAAFSQPLSGRERATTARRSGSAHLSDPLLPGTPATPESRQGSNLSCPLSSCPSSPPNAVVFSSNKSRAPPRRTCSEANTSPESDTYLWSSVFLCSVLPTERRHGGAWLSSGKSESQELTHRLHTCLCEELLKPEILFVTEVHLLHSFLIPIFSLLKPRQREQPILWKDLFNMKRVKLPMLNKIDHCETWVPPHREEAVRLLRYITRPALPAGTALFVVPREGAAKAGARAHDAILKYCSLWSFPSQTCAASEFSFDLWLLSMFNTFFTFSKLPPLPLAPRGALLFL